MVEGRRDGIRRESGDSGKERSDDGVDEKSNRRNTCRDGKGEWGGKGGGGFGPFQFPDGGLPPRCVQKPSSESGSTAPAQKKNSSEATSGPLGNRAVLLNRLVPAAENQIKKE